MHRKIWFAGLLPLLALPLMGESCTKEKVIFVAVGLDTTAGFIATGSTNALVEDETIDVGAAVDLGTALDDSGVDVDEVDDINVSRVYYRITVPEAGRTVTGTTVNVVRGTGPATGGSPVLLSNVTRDANVATDWIEITSSLNTPGVDVLNSLLDDLLAAEKNGTTAANPQIAYHITGTSNPGGDPTNFEWELKVSFNVKATQTLDVPEF